MTELSFKFNLSPYILFFIYLLIYFFLANALDKEAEMSSQQSLAKKPRRRKRMKFDAIKSDTLKDTPRILQRQPTIRNIGWYLN